MFSAEDPESLRGPQFSAAWCDELAKWRHAEATFDMLQFGLRLGERPRQVITTTPRPIALHQAADRRSGDRADAAPAPWSMPTIWRRPFSSTCSRATAARGSAGRRSTARSSRSAPTRCGRARALEACRVDAAPALTRIVVAVDPPASARQGADACGLVAAGRADDGTIYVLADDSAAGLSPQAWAVKAIALWRRLQADALVAEVNHGGDMVRAVIREADRAVPVVTVRATRGKYLRAEPVAQLYEQGRVKHAGVFPALEDEMCDFGLDGLSSGPLARPARRAGLGGDGAEFRGAGGATGEGVIGNARNAIPSIPRTSSNAGWHQTRIISFGRTGGGMWQASRN